MHLCGGAVFERMAFSIAFTTIAEENGLTETEKGLAMASYYFGFTVSQVSMHLHRSARDL